MHRLCWPSCWTETLLQLCFAAVRRSWDPGRGGKGIHCTRSLDSGDLRLPVVSLRQDLLDIKNLNPGSLGVQQDGRETCLSFAYMKAGIQLVSVCNALFGLFWCAILPIVHLIVRKRSRVELNLKWHGTHSDTALGKLYKQSSCFISPPPWALSNFCCFD